VTNRACPDHAMSAATTRVDNTVSRYPLDPLTSGFDIAVGWDPAGTFFVYVFDLRNSRSVTVVNVGDRPRELTDPAEVIALVGKHAHIPADLEELLAADAANGGSTVPVGAGPQALERTSRDQL